MNLIYNITPAKMFRMLNYMFFYIFFFLKCLGKCFNFSHQVNIIKNSKKSEIKDWGR